MRSKTIIFNKTLLALFVSTSILLTRCVSDSDKDDTNPTPTTPSESEDNTVQSEATLVSEDANIAVFGNVESANFSETQLKSGKGVLLLDDKAVNAVGFALEAGGETQDLNQFASKNLADFITLLQENNATVNVLVNRVSTNTQGQVTNVTLDIDFASAENVTKVRDLLLAFLNGGSSVSTPAKVTLAENKLRLNLSFWVVGDTGFIWANTYAAKDATAVNKVYGDLNLASALTSNVALSVKSATEKFTQNAQGSNAVDILWNIDSSGSMGEEQANLADGASQFFTTLNQAGVDYRLAVNTQDSDECTQLRALADGAWRYIDKNTPNAVTEWATLASPGTSDSSNETGFYCARAVDLTGFDRPNAKNLIVMVSDEPENETADENIYISSDYTARDFTDYKNFFLGTGSTYFAISGTGNYVRNTFSDPANNYYSTPSENCSGEGGSAVGGGHFKEIAKLTGGSSASICADASSWTVVFDEIIKAASALASQFALKQVPIPSTLQVKVAGKDVARDTAHQNGFDLVYSVDGATVVFYGDALPTANQKVDVSYDYLQQ